MKQFMTSGITGEIRNDRKVIKPNHTHGGTAAVTAHPPSWREETAVMPHFPCVDVISFSF